MIRANTKQKPEHVRKDLILHAFVVFERKQNLIKHIVVHFYVQQLTIFLFCFILHYYISQQQ